MRLLILILAGVGLTVPLRSYVVEPILVASASMEPALPVGARFVADKVTLKLRAPRRGDVVLFPSPVGIPAGIGKRVIGLPGEVVELRKGTVYVDRKELWEPYVVLGSTKSVGPLFVPAGKVFVLGDNRARSEDSSSWKTPEGKPVRFIPISSLTGLVRPSSGVKQAQGGGEVLMVRSARVLLRGLLPAGNHAL